MEELETLIKNLKIRKAAGPDEIHVFMLKYGNNYIKNILLKIINKSLRAGVLPKLWRTGTIIPIPKNNNHIIKIAEFRPICLNSIPGKLLESFVCSKLNEIVERDKLIPTFQNGFRKNRSTIDNLIVIQQAIHSSSREKKVLLAAFLDIKKAYDCVNRNKLFKILKSLNIPAQLLLWLKDFLLNSRVARVSYKGVKSSERQFLYGLPQGSPISPILFNIYTKNIKSVIKNNISQFADDIMIWTINNDIEIAAQELNNKLYKLDRWAKQLNLTFSPEKCRVIPFTRKYKLNLNKISIKLKDKNILITDRVKYLGIVFDQRLAWKYHIKEIISKAIKRIGLLKILCKKNIGIKQSQAIILYKALVRPIIEYGAEVWGDISQTFKNKLDSVQHHALTTCLGVNRKSHRNNQ